LPVRQLLVQAPFICTPRVLMTHQPATKPAHLPRKTISVPRAAKLLIFMHFPFSFRCPGQNPALSSSPPLPCLSRVRAQVKPKAARRRNPPLPPPLSNGGSPVPSKPPHFSPVLPFNLPLLVAFSILPQPKAGACWTNLRPRACWVWGEWRGR
jgi:hypothetical protein